MKLLSLGLFTFTFFVILFTSCSGNEADVKSGISETAHAILPESKTGVIRGVSLNASTADVKASEKSAKLVKETAERLEYSFKSGQDDILLLYDFDTEGLFKIDISTKSRNEKAAQDLANELVDMIKTKYGEPKIEDGVTFWEIADKNLAIEVSQKKKSTELIVKYFEN